ncbi:MAG: DUF748 domain-containing protein [Bacteroidales bacterium]|nr:DUF748 domain-containing protein [Bacteroidales bacterium]
MKLKLKIKKRYIALLGFLTLIFLLLFFLSGIIRWWIVKNSEELIGRKIDLAELQINYLKCSVKAGYFVMYEQNKKDTFVSFEELYIDFEPWQMLKSTYAFAEIRLVKPVVSIIYNDSLFNFDDLINSSDTLDIDTTSLESTDTTKYLVKNISILEGYIKYEDKSVSNITELNELSIKVPEISWNSNRSEMGIDFILGSDGKVSLGGVINQAEGLYEVTLKTENIDIAPYLSYALPYMDINSMMGRLYTDLLLSGNMNDPMNIKIFGNAGLNRLSLNDNQDVSFFNMNNIHVIFDSLDIGNSVYNISSIKLENPQLIAVLENGGTNFDKILAPYFADTLNVDTIDTDTTIIHYAIDSLIIKGGNIAFSDLTLNRPFHFDIQNFDYVLTSFSDSAAKIPMTFSMNLNRTGTFSGKAILDIVNTDNIFFEGILANLDLLSFSPYSEYYLARPIIKGVFNYNIKLRMTPHTLDNKNNIKISNLELGKKTKDTTAYKVPIGLALYILKDRRNNIVIDLPVSGNPSNPSFKLRKIIWKTLEEFLLKAVSEPFNAIGNVFETNPESIKQIPFGILQDTLLQEQTNILEKISDIIQSKPDLTFTFIQTTDPDKEKQLLSLNESKKLFYERFVNQQQNSVVITESSTIRDNDPAFLNFLGITESNMQDSLFIACIQKAGIEKTEQLLQNLLSKREQLLRNYFTEKNIPAEALEFKITDLRNLPEEMKKIKFIIEISLK